MARISVEQFRAKSKYKNVKVVRDGRTFDSKAEAARYDELLLLERIGKIDRLECQPVYVLQAKPRITYRGDYRYYEQGREICEDVKGVETAVFRLKKRMFQCQFPNVELRIVRKRKA